MSATKRELLTAAVVMLQRLEVKVDECLSLTTLSDEDEQLLNVVKQPGSVVVVQADRVRLIGMWAACRILVEAMNEGAPPERIKVELERATVALRECGEVGL